MSESSPPDPPVETAEEISEIPKTTIVPETRGPDTTRIVTTSISEQAIRPEISESELSKFHQIHSKFVKPLSVLEREGWWSVNII